MTKKVESFVVRNRPAEPHQLMKDVSLFNPDGTTFAGGRILLQHSVYQHPTEWQYANLDHITATGPLSLCGWGPGVTDVIRDANTRSYFHKDVVPDSAENLEGGYNWTPPSSGTIEIFLRAQVNWNSAPSAEDPISINAGLHGSAYDNFLDGQLNTVQFSGPELAEATFALAFDKDYWSDTKVSYSTYFMPKTGVTQEFGLRRLMYTVSFVPNTAINDYPAAAWPFG